MTDDWVVVWRDGGNRITASAEGLTFRQAVVCAKRHYQNLEVKP